MADTASIYWDEAFVIWHQIDWPQVTGAFRIFALRNRTLKVQIEEEIQRDRQPYGKADIRYRVVRPVKGRPGNDLLFEGRYKVKTREETQHDELPLSHRERQSGSAR